MKCLRCQKEQNRKICYSCMKLYNGMRTKIWETLTEKYGKMNPDNHSIFIKETKRLENIWRKNKAKFVTEIDKILDDIDPTTSENRKYCIDTKRY